MCVCVKSIVLFTTKLLFEIGKYGVCVGVGGGATDLSVKGAKTCKPIFFRYIIVR